MKKILLFLLLLSGFAHAQVTYIISADSTKLRKVSGNNELIIENATRNVPGILVNKGGGRTEFARVRSSGDTLFVGRDTVLLQPTVNITASNGLTKSGTDIQLGGTLDEPETVIDAQGNNFRLTNGATISLQSDNGAGTGASFLSTVAGGAGIGAAKLGRNSALSVRADSIKFDPFLGQLNIDTLQKGLATDSMMTYNPVTGRVGYKVASGGGGAQRFGFIGEDYIANEDRSVDFTNHDMVFDNVNIFEVIADSLQTTTNHLILGGGSQTIKLHGDSAEVSKRISYSGNLHGSFTARSLVDKSYVDSVDALVVHKAGTESITGTKTFTGSTYLATSSGSVGIGTASPATKLDVSNGTGHFYIDFPSPSPEVTSSHDFYFKSNNGNSVYFGQNNRIAVSIQSGNGLAIGNSYITTPPPSDGMIVQGNTALGKTTAAERLDVNGNIVASGTITPSDMRYKKNIKSIRSAMSVINRLKPSTYNMVSGINGREFDDKTHMGLIAQEVEQVLPSVVHTDDNGYKSVNYTELIPLLIQALKEQQKQIDELKKRIK